MQPLSKQDIKDMLVFDLTEKVINHIKDICLKSTEYTQHLWEIAIENSYPASWRAAWVYAKVADINPEMAKPHVLEIPKLLLAFTHDGQKRELLKVILLFPLIEQDMGLILNICFDWLASPKETAAVRVHSMQIVYEISKVEPDLQPELKLMLLQLMPDAEPGMLSRGTKILAKLSNVDVWNRM